MRDESEILGPIPELTNKSKDEMNYCTAISRRIFSLLGIWPDDPPASKFEQIFIKTRVVICYFLMLFLIIPMGLHIILVEKNIYKKIKMVGPFLYYITAMAKYTLLVTRKKAILQCLNHVFVDLRRCNSPIDHDIMFKCVKVNRIIGGICAIFTYCSGIFFRLVIPLSQGKRVGPNNITIRPLGSPIYRPLFTADDTPSYEIVYTIQTMASVVITSTTAGAGCFAALLVLHACGQLKIVMNRLDSFVGETLYSKNVLENRMAEIIELHLRVLNFVMRVESIINEVCLVEFVASMINICMMVYTLTMEIRGADCIAIVGWAVIVITFTFNIFILCYIGEMLAEESKNVGTTAYQIDWYKLPDKTAKGLILLLAMTNYPCRITAGKMAELSYRSFSGLLKTSMGYLNLLRTVTS